MPSAHSLSFSTPATTTTSAATPVVASALQTPPTATASQKKLSMLDSSEDDSDEVELESEGLGQRMFELPALQLALSEAVCCKSCGSGSIILKEDLSNQQGLYTRPYLFCEQCANTTYVPFSSCGSSKVCAINRYALYLRTDVLVALTQASQCFVPYLIFLLRWHDVHTRSISRIYLVGAQILCKRACAKPERR